MWHVRGILSALLVLGLVVPPRTCCVLIDCCQREADAVELAAAERDACQRTVGWFAFSQSLRFLPRRSTVANSCCRLGRDKSA
jgi:hypothetical protein